MRLISGFCRDVEICGLLGYYAASCGNCLAVITSHSLLPRRTFQNLRYMLSFLIRLLTREDGTDTLSQNVGKQLPHDAV
jgi:hypothetical protein